MNKGGSVLLFSIITAVFLFAAGMIFLNFIMPEIDTARTALDCAGNISDGAKVLCLGTDLLIPYLIITIISISGGILTARFLI